MLPEIRTWKVEDVCHWLKGLQLDNLDLLDIVRAEQIDGEVLAIMTMAEFETVFGDRLKFGQRKKIIHRRDMLLNDEPAQDIEDQTCFTKPPLRKTDKSTSEILRSFDQDISVSFKYEQGTIANIFGKSSHDLLRPIHNFVHIDFQSKHKLNLFDFGDKTIKFICACLNDRTNGTVHFGIVPEATDQNREYEIIGTALSAEKNEYRKYISKAINECFYPDQRDIVQSCTRQPKFIEVITTDSASDHPRFVIEIDVIPSSTLCGDAVFDVHLPNEKKMGNVMSFGKAEIYRFHEGEPQILNDLSLRTFMEFKQKLTLYRREQEGKTVPLNSNKVNLTEKLTRLLCGVEQQFYADRVFPLLVVNRPAEHMHDSFLKQNLNFLSRIEFKAVFDFDKDASLFNFFESTQDQVLRVLPTTEEFDIRSEVNHTNPERLKNLHDDLKTSVQIPWIFANGYRINDDEAFAPLQWKKNRREGLKCAVRFFGEEIPAYRAVVVFCLLSKDWKVMLEAAEEFLSTFPDHWICIVEDEHIAGPWIEELKHRHCVDDNSVKENMIIGLPWKNVCETIKSLTTDPDRTACTLPTSNQGLCTLEKHVKNDMCDLEILGSNACEVGELDMDKMCNEMEEQFYRGAEVDWWNFAFQTHVCKREKLGDLKRKVRESLQGKSLADDNLVGRVVLYHQPGAGGSTVARNVLWDFRKEYRCAVIRNITDMTADQIARFRSYKDDNEADPVLLLLDNHDEEKTNMLWAFLEREARRVMRENEHQRIMCVLLICLRRSVLDYQHSSTVILKQELNPLEKQWFKTHTFSNKNIDPTCLISFNIMKENFDKIIMSETVKHFVSSIENEKEMLLLKYISLINTYDIDFRPIPTAAFDCFMTDCFKKTKGTLLYSTSMRMGSGVKMKRWENDLSGSFHTLMNKTRRLGMGYIHSLRITNHFLAECVLEIIQNNKGVKQMISDVAMEFVQSKDIFTTATGMACNDLKKTIKDMLKRRERSMTGKPETQFAPLIQHIVQNESVEKAKHLLKTFYVISEKDPFISQQIARLCIYNNEWEEANDYAGKATAQKPDNSYLWDTYGRASLGQISSMYNTLLDQSDVSKEDITFIVKLAFAGIDRFQRVQELSVDEYAVYVNDAGFFGQLETISKLLDCFCLMHPFRDNREMLHSFLVKRDYVPTELQFLTNVEGQHFLIRLKQLQSDVDRVVRHLEDEKIQLREGVLDEYRKGHFRISQDRLIQLKSNLGEYFGEHDYNIPSNLSLEEACDYRRRHTFYLAGNTLAQIYDLRFEGEKGENVLRQIWEMSTSNINAKCGNEQDYKVNLCASFALILVSGKYIYKLNHSTIVEYSKELYSLRNQGENHRFVSLEPYLFYVMLNWPGRNTSTPNMFHIVLPDVLKQWKEAYYKKYPRQRDEGKPYKKKDTTMFFLANGSDLHSIASYEELRGNLTKAPHTRKDEFWSQPHVLRQLKRFEGTLHGDGSEVKLKLGLDSVSKSVIYIPTSFPIRHKSWWYKTVFFVIGFSWFGPKAFDVNAVDPTADPKNLTSGDDMHNRIERPLVNVERTVWIKESRQTHAKFLGRMSRLDSQLEAINVIKSKRDNGQRITKEEVSSHGNNGSIIYSRT